MTSPADLISEIWGPAPAPPSTSTPQPKRTMPWNVDSDPSEQPETGAVRNGRSRPSKAVGPLDGARWSPPKSSWFASGRIGQGGTGSNAAGGTPAGKVEGAEGSGGGGREGDSPKTRRAKAVFGEGWSRAVGGGATPVKASEKVGGTEGSKKEEGEDKGRPVRAQGPLTKEEDEMQTLADSFMNAPAGEKCPAPRYPSAGDIPLSIEAQVTMSREQQAALRIMLGGESMYFTGAAGTGKSVLLRQIVRSARRMYPGPDQVAVTASTGIAACHVRGVTLNSWAGIGLGAGSVEDLFKRLWTNKAAVKRWQGAKVLIVDEVSMVDGSLLDKLCELGQMVRRKTVPVGKGKSSNKDAILADAEKPFGGIQVILTGDFHQLPPVEKEHGPRRRYGFEANCWDQCVTRTVELTQVFRQKDQAFVDVLNELRVGKTSETAVRLLKGLARVVTYPDGLLPTELYPKRKEVDRANKARLDQLDTDWREYRANDGSGEHTTKEKHDMYLSSLLAPKYLKLKIGAQVMLVKNMEESLVNGSIGKVVGFMTQLEWMALKMQGTVENEVDPMDDLAGDPREEPEEVPRKATNKDFPVVRFALERGRWVDEQVVVEEFKVEGPTGTTLASRKQIPLVLAWAMSIHKSQGQTLQRVKIDLKNVFEKGQAYVALSRATSLDCLELWNFDKSRIRHDKRVTKWHETLERL